MPEDSADIIHEICKECHHSNETKTRGKSTYQQNNNIIIVLLNELVNPFTNPPHVECHYCLRDSAILAIMVHIEMYLRLQGVFF